MNNIIITCGDINGIGTEISLKAIDHLNLNKTKITFICPKNVFDKTARLVNFKKDFFATNSVSKIISTENKLKILLLNDTNITVGRPTKYSGAISYQTLEIARILLDNAESKILVTAPISKDSLKKAGYNFSGHTELIASWFNSKNYLMTFLSKDFKAALVTIHVPLNKVSELLSTELIKNKISILYKSLKNDFGISLPKIAVLGLNPHAGEEGNIGDEEFEYIRPAICSMKRFSVDGPFVPDAFFAKKLYKAYDAVVGMYHDQVLIPFKLINFNSGVNFTAGLPIIRTSPDHGTAFDIAWQNKADEQSMLNAIKYALQINAHRNKIPNG